MKPANIAPMLACLYPGMAEKARSLGYALTIHGSVVTDLDLVAIPWVEKPKVDSLGLKNALLEHISACGYGDLLRRDGVPEEFVAGILARKENRGCDDGEKKPHGRVAWNLYLYCGVKVDLSVMPQVI